jgi:Tfp pilus assembly protein PilZ
MKSVKVTFPNGRELLDSYWGLLANGGLVLPEPAGLHEGDQVSLELTIESSGQRHLLNGRVVRTPPHAENEPGRVIIAFDPGEPHDLLLSSAWADLENVAPRRARRFALDVDVRFHDPEAGAETAARLLNVSLGGCCLRVARSADPSKTSVGKPLTIISHRGKLNGVVRWSEGSCRGIEFQGGDPKVVEGFVEQFLSA